MNSLFYGEILSGRGVPEVKGLFEREGLTVQGTKAVTLTV
jgi:hypothetical protein